MPPWFVVRLHLSLIERRLRVRRARAVFRRSWRAATAKESHAEDLPPDEICPHVAALALSGAMHLCLFFPLLVYLASREGLSLSGLLLLQDLPTDLLGTASPDVFPQFALPNARAFLVAMGTGFGALEIAAALAILAGGWLRLGILGGGLWLGLSFTWFLASVIDPAVPRMQLTVTNGLRFIPILVLLLLSESIPFLVAPSEHRRLKVTFLLSGLFGLASAWILARAFGSSSGLLAGSLFLGVTFLMTWFCEKALVFEIRFWQAMMEAMLPRSEAVTVMAFVAERSISIPTAIRSISRSCRDNRLLTIALFSNLAFMPLIVALFYHMLLEGRW